jgi:histidine phosphotransferase ChpT
MNTADFASLLCSRLCHDLMSPVGALNNGIELLADEQDPEMRDRCLELLADSARATANKLKFFRLAFGAAGGFGDEVDSGEARAALEGLTGSDGKIELGWMVADAKLPKGPMKVLLNLALIAVDALVRGGRLDIGAESNGGFEIAIRAEGPRIALDPAIGETLVNGSGFGRGIGGAADRGRLARAQSCRRGGRGNPVFAAVGRSADDRSVAPGTGHLDKLGTQITRR